MSAGGHCRQNDRNDQGGYHQCPEVMKNHHHDRVRQAHTCYLMKADAGRQKLKTDFYSTFQRHDNTSNKEADKSVPTICWTLCWPSGHYNEVQMKGRGWNILRKGNTNSWEGSQAFHVVKWGAEINAMTSERGTLPFTVRVHSADSIQGNILATGKHQHKILIFNTTPHILL